MNKQRVLSLVLALTMLLGAFGIVSAAETNKSEVNDNKIQWLVDNEVVEGRKVNENAEDNDLALDKSLTRAEVTKLIVYTLGKQDLANALEGVIKPFPDVSLDHWANGWISVAATERINKDNSNGIIIGYEDGEFKPSREVTYAELATMLVRIVKKDLTKAMEDRAIWSTDYMRWAEELGILDGIKVTDSNKAVNRYDAFVMIYNAMKKIGKTDHNDKVKFGDLMGVVSKAQAGKIQLNQDAEMEYEVTWNTRFTDGTTIRDIANNAVKPGSLVRLIANDKKEIEFVIELGSPRDGAIDGRWFEVADKVAETANFPRNGQEAQGKAYFMDEYFKTIVIGGVRADIVSKTRFFVADVPNNALKEVKDLATVFNLYLRDWRDLQEVYMGYDEFADGKVKEATVIVFGKVDKFQGTKDVRRVTNFYNSKHSFSAEDTKGKQERFDLANTDYFARREYVDVRDVVRIYHDGERTQTDKGYVGNNRKTGGLEVLIDYSKDPVFRVVELDKGDRRITLRDKFDREREFVLDRDVYVFLEDQLKKDVHVQAHFNRDNTVVDVLSIVDKDLKGAVPTGVRVGQQRGYLTAFREVNPSVYALTIAKWDKEVGFYGHEALYLHISDMSDVRFLDAQLQAYKNVLNRYDANGNGRLDVAEYKKYLNETPEANRKYFEIVFDVDKQFGGTDFAYNFERYAGVGNQYNPGSVVPTDNRWPIDADARLSNRSNQPLTVRAVKGVRLTTPLVIEPNSYVGSYTNNAGERVNFRANDELIVQAPCTAGECYLDSFEITRDCAGQETKDETKVCQIENRSNCCGQDTSVCHEYECATKVVLGCLTEVKAIYRQNIVQDLELAVRSEACPECQWYVLTNWDNSSSVEILSREVTLVPGQGKLRVDLVVKGKNGVKLAVQGSNPVEYKEQVNYSFLVPADRHITSCTDNCEFKQVEKIKLNVLCGYNFQSGNIPVAPVKKAPTFTAVNKSVINIYRLNLNDYTDAVRYTATTADGTKVVNNEAIDYLLGLTPQTGSVKLELFNAAGETIWSKTVSVPNK